MTLQYEYSSHDNVLGKGSNEFFKCPKLLLYHRSEAFDLKLSASRYLHLDRNRSLEIELSPGWNNVKSGELHVRAATSGLRLQTSETKVSEGSLEISKNSEVGVILFRSLNAHSTAKFRMPFNLEHEVNEISIKLEISYTTEHGTFFFATTPSVSIMLPLGVNVQDFFKHKALFSKFTITSATPSPLRLLSSQLEGSDTFDAQGGLALSKPIFVFPRQPASMLYKITNKSSAATPKPVGKGRGRKSSLSLVLHYICLEEEIEIAIARDLHRMFEGGPLYPYMRLVIPVVNSELRARLSPYDLERTAILNELSTSLLTSVRWRDHFSGLGYSTEHGRDIGSLLAETLQAWQQQHPSLPLTPIKLSDKLLARSRSIMIPVDVPSVAVVHTADLKLLGSSSVSANTAVTASNQPISASLTVKWTRIWDSEASTSATSDEGEDHEFFYDVSGASDTWLIGGRRRGHFKVPRKPGIINSTQTLSFPVVLIPLREGFLPYPNVEIKPLKIRNHLMDGTQADEALTYGNQPTVSCETDYKNAGELIRVISDARKMTVSLDASGPQGGAWLLESERRGVGNSSVVLG
jgi:hypothetical protein